MGGKREGVVAVGLARRAGMLADKARQYAGLLEVETELHGIRLGDVALVGFAGAGEQVVEGSLALLAALRA